jgi:hypothetical protein
MRTINSASLTAVLHHKHYVAADIRAMASTTTDFHCKVVAAHGTQIQAPQAVDVVVKAATGNIPIVRMKAIASVATGHGLLSGRNSYSVMRMATGINALLLLHLPLGADAGGTADGIDGDGAAEDAGDGVYEDL